jgi:FMN phosphatase YigB (HAD superfamily)
MFHILPLLLSFFVGTIAPTASNLTPENTFLAFDLDDVVIEKSFWHRPKLVFGGIALDPLNGYTYIDALLGVKSSYKRDASGDKEALLDKHGNSIMGLTFQFLYHGIRDKRFTPYVAWIVKTMEHSRCFITDTKKTILYLKSKGYTIAFATNKDRVSYDLTAQAFGDEFTDLPDKVFVAQPGNNDIVLKQFEEFAQQADTPESYRALTEQALHVQESGNVFHAPGRKPNKEYYQHVHTTVGADKNFIFIDDKKANVKGFNSLQSSTDAQLHGIHFKNPAQLTDELVKRGILSEVDDQEFLQEIRNPGVIGKTKRQLAKIIALSQSVCFSRS